MLQGEFGSGSLYTLRTTGTVDRLPGGADYPAGRGYVRLWMSRDEFMAQKADGTVRPWGR